MFQTKLNTNDAKLELPLFPSTNLQLGLKCSNFLGLQSGKKEKDEALS